MQRPIPSSASPVTSPLQQTTLTPPAEHLTPHSPPPVTSPLPHSPSPTNHQPTVLSLRSPPRAAEHRRPHPPPLVSSPLPHSLPPTNHHPPVTTQLNSPSREAEPRIPPRRNLPPLHQVIRDSSSPSPARSPLRPPPPPPPDGPLYLTLPPPETPAEKFPAPPPVGAHRLLGDELGLRFTAMVLALVAFSVMAADKTVGWAGDSFDRYKEYRYLLSINVIAFAYSAFHVYVYFHYLITKKYLIDRTTEGYFSFTMDQVLAYLLMSASSSAATRTDAWVSMFGSDDFTDMASGSIAMSFLAFAALALSSLISSYNLFHRNA